MKKKKNSGNVMVEYIMVLLLFSIGVYTTIARENEDSTVPSLVEALNERQNTFVDHIHEL